ncbi:YceI family protein [uncultured Algibacter sp.]|uniref:YceI family protein n=1 Tax=uncultured Algibacter sp. TaxID=298659 RepID=UPI00262C370D|nr:YceI family protein [uncultured Algibacter sp.]
MRKVGILLIALALVVTSCKNEKKESKTETTPTEKFVVKPEATSITWKAYKTTEKIGVGGEFTTVNFKEQAGASPQEALNNLSFSIPISSLFTNDATNTRDAKIKTSFFGAMLDTELIKGTLNYENDIVVASLTMNGVTHNLPMDIIITEERRVSLTGTMNLADWNALDALASLNKVCFDLHKGPDGISKTWEDVAIEVNTFLRKN